MPVGSAMDMVLFLVNFWNTFSTNIVTLPKKNNTTDIQVVYLKELSFGYKKNMRISE